MRLGIGGGGRILRGGVSVGRGGVRGGVGVGPFSISGGSRGSRGGGGGGDSPTVLEWLIYLPLLFVIIGLYVITVFTVGLIGGGLVFLLLVQVCQEPASTRHVPVRVARWLQRLSRQTQRNATKWALVVASSTLAINLWNPIHLWVGNRLTPSGSEGPEPIFPDSFFLHNPWVKLVNVVGALLLAAGLRLYCTRAWKRRAARRGVKPRRGPGTRF